MSLSTLFCNLNFTDSGYTLFLLIFDEKTHVFWKGVRGITLFSKKGFPRQGLGQSPNIPERKVDFRVSDGPDNTVVSPEKMEQGQKAQIVIIRGIRHERSAAGFRSNVGHKAY